MSELLKLVDEVAEDEQIWPHPTRPLALVSMPPLSGRFPSFQLALLSATLQRHQIPHQCFSLFLYFGTHVGWRLNEALSEVVGALVGEWLWSVAAYGRRENQDELDIEYFRKFGSEIDALCARAEVSRESLLRLRDEGVEGFLDFCIDATDWSRFHTVGLSCVFQQTLSSLAFARRLKARYPHLKIILGGGFFEDEIAEQIITHTEAVDFIHCGDADETLADICRRLAAGDDLEEQIGIYRRTDDGVAFAGRAPNLEKLDETPVPDFDEYFYARQEGGYLNYSGTEEVMLPIETGRGCWWGMKNHCTFCGLNRAGMAFRHKSAPEVLEMLGELHRRYGQLYFDAIDNIMAPEYVEELFDTLAEAESDVRIHYEVRPNLKRDQLRRMKKGGLHSVQPGIESLSTKLLLTMNKRTTAMRNLEFMKWCTHYGIHNLYNILLRFTGETQADYDEQVGLIDKIPHFQPPKFVTTVRADRGSPMFTDPESCGVENLRPAGVYPFLYPERFDLDKVAYYFEHDMPTARADYAPIRRAVMQWQASWRAQVRPRFFFEKSWDTLTLVDARRREAERTVLEGDDCALYLAMSDARPREQLLRDRDEAFVDDRLAQWCERDFIVERDERFLALALPMRRRL